MITLTTKDALFVNKALPALGGYSKAVGEQIAFVPYKLTDATRKKIRRIKKAVKEITEDHEEAYKALIRELSPVHEDVSKESPESLKAFTKRAEDLLKETHSIDAETIDMDGELLVENKNPIPDEILDALEPVFTQAGKVEKAEAIPGGE